MIPSLTDLVSHREMRRIAEHAQSVGGLLWLNHRHKAEDEAWVTDLARRTNRKLAVIDPLAGYKGVSYNPVRGTPEAIARRVLSPFGLEDSLLCGLLVRMLAEGMAVGKRLSLTDIAGGISLSADQMTEAEFGLLRPRGDARMDEAGLDGYRRVCRDVAGHLLLMARSGTFDPMEMGKPLIPEDAIAEGAIVYVAAPMHNTGEGAVLTDVGRDMLKDVGSMILHDVKDTRERLVGHPPLRDPALGFGVFYHSWYFDRNATEAGKEGYAA